MNLDNKRVGHGFDVHPFGSEPGKSLVLGGVKFDLPGLVGHSDGDVVVHAIIDALLSPLGLGDIGSLFSDEDASTKGADSIGYLKGVMRLVADAGWQVCNIDLTVVADRPKIVDVKAEMVSNIQEITGGYISIKGKRSEGVVHNIEAVECHAVSLLEKVTNE